MAFDDGEFTLMRVKTEPVGKSPCMWVTRMMQAATPAQGFLSGPEGAPPLLDSRVSFLLSGLTGVWGSLEALGIISGLSF